MQFNGLIFYSFSWQQVGEKQFACSYQTNSFVGRNYEFHGYETVSFAGGNSEFPPYETGETLNGPEIVDIF